MARPKAVPGAVPTRVRILDAAEAVFAQVGFDAARLADVAADVGIRRPSLLYHFGSKETLYAAVVQRAFRDLGNALLSTLTDTGELESTLEGLVQTFVGFVEGRPGFAALVLREFLDGHGGGQVLLSQVMVPLLDQVVDQVDQRIPGGRGERVRLALLQVAATALLRSASGELREPLWGTGAGLDTDFLRRMILSP
jgi:AcrR family transcriptional regulator